MKINELAPSIAKTLVKSNWDHPEQIAQFLEKNGYEELGQGAFSVAFGNNSNAIVKISYKQDVCWLKFAQLAQQNQSNRHFPKISRIKTFKDNAGKDCFLAFVERLIPIKRNMLDVTALSIFMEDVDPGAYWDQYNQNIPEQNRGKIRDYFIRKYPDFTQAINLVQQNLDAKCGLDLHDKNIMVRPKTGDFVIIDPSSAYYTSKP